MAFNWSASGYATGSVLRFIVGVMLARLLGPEPFGQVAVALLAIGLGNMLSEFGLGTVLVQRDDASPELTQSIFTVQTLLGLTNAVLWWVLSPMLTSFMHVEEATGAVRLLALAFFFSALGQTSGAMLRRQLRIKRMQGIQISTYVFAYVGLGLPLAWSGAGVWSLVLAQIAQSFLNSLMMYLSVKHNLFPSVRALSWNIIVSGARVAGSSITDWGITNIDTFIAGRVFGPVSLGLYNRSYFSAYTPANVVASSLKSVMLPILSRFKDDRALVSQAFLSILTITTYLSVAAFGSLALIAETFIEAVYGAEWSDAVPLLRPLSLGMVPLVLLSIVTSTLWAIGEIKRELSLQLLTGLLALATYFAFASVSIEALSWGVALVFLTRFLMLAALVGKSLGLATGKMAGALSRPIVLGSVISMAVALVDSRVWLFLGSPIVRLSLDVFVGGLLTIAILAIRPSWALGATSQWIRSELLKTPPNP